MHQIKHQLCHINMICDKLAAGIIYQGKKWNKAYPLEYWSKERERILINDNLKNMVTEIFTQVSVNGIDSVLTKKNLQVLYKKYCSNS